MEIMPNEPDAYRKVKKSVLIDCLFCARDLVDVPPALEQRAADAVHARLGAVVRVVDVVDHLFRGAPVAGREGLVPGGEDEVIRLWARVLRRFPQSASRTGYRLLENLLP